MAKRTVKTKPSVTLSLVFGEMCNVRFTFASNIARLTPRNDLNDGYAIFEKHLAAGNIVEGKIVGIFPGVPTYRIAKPDAPALI